MTWHGMYWRLNINLSTLFKTQNDAITWTSTQSCNNQIELVLSELFIETKFLCTGHVLVNARGCLSC